MKSCSDLKQSKRSKQVLKKGKPWQCFIFGRLQFGFYTNFLDVLTWWNMSLDCAFRPLHGIMSPSWHHVPMFWPFCNLVRTWAWHNDLSRLLAFLHCLIDFVQFKQVLNYCQLLWHELVFSELHSSRTNASLEMETCGYWKTTENH